MTISWTEKLKNYRFKYQCPLFYIKDRGKKTILYSIKTALFKLRVNSLDKIVVLSVWKHNEYNKHYEIKKDDIIVDIGAHIGSFSVYAAQKAENGRVYAFEPEPTNYQLLIENKRLNNLDNLTIFNKAVIGKEGKTVLKIGRINNASNSIYESDSEREVIVESTTLKNLMRLNNLDKIDFLKIDSEGAEYEILLNTPPEVIKKIGNIVLEYHDFFDHGHTYKDIQEYLCNNGFEVKRYLKYPAPFISNLIMRVVKEGLLSAENKFFRAGKINEHNS